ncbi:MAG: dienelactone hydrolase family protein [Acidobacteriota bacterium]|nr:dienelactone hydrolase family protein [Acidobacteriota bacterium]
MRARQSKRISHLLLALIVPLLGDDQTAGQKQNFVEQAGELEHYLDVKLDSSAATREAFWRRDYSSVAAYERSIEPYRPKLIELIGGTDASKPEPELRARRTLVAHKGSYDVFRTWFASRNGLTVYGILLFPKNTANHVVNHPAVLCIHGMHSSPEQVAGLIDEPDYTKRFGARLAERGYVVFAPLMMDTKEIRSRFDRKAILLGTRLQWVEQQKIFSAIDYLQSLPEVDPKRIGAYGISWGGRTAMYQGALDPRVAATVISGHFNDTVPKMVTASPHYTAFIDTPEDYAFFSKLANRFSDADVASMICPRPVFIEQGERDPVVWHPMAEEAFAALKSHYEKLHLGERAEMKVFDGAHEVHGDDAFLFLDRWLKGAR